jgi:GrpB-like predicted nucleotidyltransferase (UPF0157 family)
VDAAERDAYLDSVLIGGREKRPIVIADYDPGWPERFEQERRRISMALGPVALRIEHIGSTAVPGLAAKPIVDVLVTVKDPEAEDEAPAGLLGAGYELRVTEAGHRMFRTPARDVHVHIWADTDPEVERCIAFRDRLRRSRADRDAYERLKRELAGREWRDMNDYADAKAGLIAEILARATDP